MEIFFYIQNGELLWVPWGCGVEGNEISNTLVKRDSISPMPGPKPAIRMSVALAIADVKNWEQVPVGTNGRA